MVNDLGFHPKWVSPFYMRLMGFFNMADEERQQLADDIKSVLHEIEYETLEAMLTHMNWRPRLTAAYFIGFGKLQDHAASLGQCLIDHPDYAYPHCLALTRVDSSVAIPYLRNYLIQNLKLAPTTHFLELEILSITWAFVALQHHDEQQGTNYFGEFDPILDYFAKVNSDIHRNAIIDGLVQQIWSEERINHAQQSLDFYLQFSHDTFD